MSRKIILLSDGTGNSSAKVWRTNVWRTFEALDLSGNDQVALYDDGVGTSSFKPMAILGGAFGLGLRRNVIALYKFACRNYRDKDDELFGFGFSRGAFTIRIVMGMIDSQGLVKADNEVELHSLASAAYRAYRKDRYPKLRFERPYQWIRNKFGPHYPPREVRRNVKIRFIGVWDTVAAYGMPVDEMTRGIHDYIWPLELPNKHLSPSVMRACQALALDEERTTFHPQLWDETAGIHGAASPAEPGGKRFIKNERISQVWFAGVHTNVGGGYPDDALAHIPFVWMITEAKRCGLKFKSDYAGQPPSPDHMIADPDTFKNAISKRDKDGRLYDPRKGVGGYYRYGPRKLVPAFYPKKLEEDEVDVISAKIHETVFRRIENNAHAYAPVGLPPYYEVVKEDGEIVSPDTFSIAPSTQPFETSAAAAQRALAQEHVWNWVWARRIAYFATVGATLWLVIFPLVSSAPRYDEYTSPIRWVSDFVRFALGLLPTLASTWADGYARAPAWFLVMVGLVSALLYVNSWIAGRTSRLMASIWRKSPQAPTGLPDNGIYGLRSSPLYIHFHDKLKTRIAPFLFAVMFIYLGLAFVSHLAYDGLDTAGLTCVRRDTDPKPAVLAVNQTARVEFKTSDLCKATGILLQHRGRYYVTIQPGAKSGEDKQWFNGLARIGTPVGGFSSKERPQWYERVYLWLLLPMRREISKDWFRIVLRFGNVGGEEDSYEPDPYDDIIQFNITPTIAPNGKEELFVFVNDAVIGIPGLYDLLYRNNHGTAVLSVTRRR
ncbi:DUF2235 domain-containing protein [Bradyrhizobium sp. AUGA SZCCT0177]|uniref:DUF2235 domain-containing protein n=1 Tax=Bradyrhizobium sp. AUGA SZCCT0177 TaxID=2807665 RepID=UPI001BAA7A41|nr:DUF2235 domain-containing protein [Bradyrhizobium sp. AUGA SZCCT0177]MBR1285770.1 DUF2235 domain-containing protein [Bradyrhizobium sp. AUGA SZCCT0177]